MQLDSLELDGRSFRFKQAVIVHSFDAPRRCEWHAVLLHPAPGGLEGPSTEGRVVAYSRDGERLSGRVSLERCARGAGCLRLTGIGSLDRG